MLSTAFDRKDIPKRRTIPKILRRVITQKTYFNRDENLLIYIYLLHLEDILHFIQKLGKLRIKHRPHRKDTPKRRIIPTIYYNAS